MAGLTSSQCSENWTGPAMSSVRFGHKDRIFANRLGTGEPAGNRTVRPNLDPAGFHKSLYTTSLHIQKKKKKKRDLRIQPPPFSRSLLRRSSSPFVLAGLVFAVSSRVGSVRCPLGRRVFLSARRFLPLPLDPSRTSCFHVASCLFAQVWYI
ncbi:hypothetical protein PIB30_056461 [Stylosanthes scabra]|uniref:Transmembrane protein n=1 Tax=Stylosanthes scabra TaxID=79078 RepID=A0ABU6XKM4_9FABA|nr:hypothetical protein [Stylosanthes scabra]